MEHLDFDTGGSDAFGLLLNETIRKIARTICCILFSLSERAYFAIRSPKYLNNNCIRISPITLIH